MSRLWVRRHGDHGPGSVSDVSRSHLGRGAVAAVHARERLASPPVGITARLVEFGAVDERRAETRRRVRLSSPAIAFIGGLLALAAVIAAIILVIYALGGFGEGSEGAQRAAASSSTDGTSPHSSSRR